MDSAPPPPTRIPVAFSMETSDPDDALALAILATHPRVDLRAVVITPGSNEQVGLVRHLLRMFGLQVPVGSRSPGYPKRCVSGFHDTWLGYFPPAEPDGEGGEVLLSAVQQCPRITIVSGAALTNVARMVKSGTPVLHVVVQGGFAGDSIVAPEHRLPKFAGRETCPTFNLGGDIEAAECVLAAPNVSRRTLVSKNVCHGVIWDEAMHTRLAWVTKHLGLKLAYQGMTAYLEKKSSGKAAHDLVAATMALDYSVCDVRQVEPYHVKNEWGCRLSNGTGTFITVSVDRDRFEACLVR